MSYNAPLIRLETYLEKKLASEQSVCFAIGAIAHGSDDFADDWVDHKMAVSGYSLYANAVYVSSSVTSLIAPVAAWSLARARMHSISSRRILYPNGQLYLYCHLGG